MNTWPEFNAQGLNFKELGVAMHTRNSGAGDVKTGGSLGALWPTSLASSVSSGWQGALSQMMKQTEIKGQQPENENFHMCVLDTHSHKHARTYIALKTRARVLLSSRALA